jgi:hypothetical protein
MTQLSHAQSLVIGNSGNGIYFESTDQVYLLDLLEYEIYDFEDLGSATAVAMNNISENYPKSNTLNALFDPTLSFDTRFLAYKISSLEAYHPLMDDIFIETLKSFRWVGLNQKLKPISKIENFFAIGGEHIQIANRHGNTIRISLEAWTKMSDLHKTALIFHEVLFSLIKLQVNPENPKYYYQSELRVREIVGLLFSTYGQITSHKKNIVYNIFESDLEIPFERLTKYGSPELPFIIRYKEYQTKYGTEIKIQIVSNQQLAECEMIKSDLTCSTRPKHKLRFDL